MLRLGSRASTCKAELSTQNEDRQLPGSLNFPHQPRLAPHQPHIESIILASVYKFVIMKFPELSYSALSAEAAQYKQRRAWKASLANWILLVLLVTGGLFYISQSLNTSMPSTCLSSQGLQAPSDDVEAQANGTWFFTGWQVRTCSSGPIGPFKGNSSTNCSNLAPGIAGLAATWTWTQADQFNLLLFGAQDCEPIVQNISAKAACDPVAFFSWRVDSNDKE